MISLILMFTILFGSQISDRMLRAQSDVLRYFGYEFEQVRCKEFEADAGSVAHGKAMDWFMVSTIREQYFFLDVDAIPLHADVELVAKCKITDDRTLFGVAQDAGHCSIIGHTYVAPAFMCFTRKCWGMCGQPSFCPDSNTDTGENFTYRAAKSGVNVCLVYPSSTEVYRWNLRHEGVAFGDGTTYGNLIYHGFRSSCNEDMFVRKCGGVLGMASWDHCETFVS